MKISIVVHPNSKKPGIKKDKSKMLHIYVSEAACKGKANRAVETSLAKYFKTKKKNIFIIKGIKSKNKSIEIVGLKEKLVRK